MWFTDNRAAWEIELDKLYIKDYEKLGIEKEELVKILDQLYEWKVIR